MSSVEARADSKPTKAAKHPRLVEWDTVAAQHEVVLNAFRDTLLQLPSEIANTLRDGKGAFEVEPATASWITQRMSESVEAALNDAADRLAAVGL